MKQSFLVLIALLSFACHDDNNNSSTTYSDFELVANYNLVSFSIDDNWEIYVQYPSQIYIGEDAYMYYAIKAVDHGDHSEKPAASLSTDNGDLSFQADKKTIVIQNCLLGDVNINLYNRKISFSIIDKEYNDHKTHLIQVTTPSTSGSNPITWGAVSGGGTFQYGIQRTIQAIPKKGYNFYGWFNETGIKVSERPNCTFIIIQPKTFIALFQDSNGNVLTGRRE
jgi:hypothetical protein